MGLVIYNVLMATNDDQNRIFPNAALAVENSKIIELAPEKELLEKYPDFQKLDGRGKLLMPGLINAHMHFYSTYARGIPLTASPANFPEILQDLWWKLDRALDLEAVYYSTLIPAITGIRRGVTSFIDHHASPHAVEGSLDEVERALSELGLRGILCYEVSDRDGKEIAQKGLEENLRYMKKCQQSLGENPHHLFDGMMGLHASFTVDDDTLARAAEEAKKLDRGCHIHLLEDSSDGELSLEKYGKRPVQRLRDAGALGKKTITAHCIHLSEEEKALLAGSGTIITHQPTSNMNNAVGRADIFNYLDRGCLLGLGTDGMSPSVIPDIQTALYLQKHDLEDFNVGWMEVEKMVLKNNPAIYERLSGQKVGCIETGWQADLILVDYYPPTPLTSENFWGHFLFGISQAEVDTVVVAGKVVMENKVIPGIDEPQIATRSRKVARRVWERFTG